MNKPAQKNLTNQPKTLKPTRHRNLLNDGLFFPGPCVLERAAADCTW